MINLGVENIFAPKFYLNSMKHPLEKYRLIAEANFILQMEGKFYSDYYAELSNGLDVIIEKDKNRIIVGGLDSEGNGYSTYVRFRDYFLSQYNKLETEARSNIDGVILLNVDEEKLTVFIERIIVELNLIQATIDKYDVSRKNKAYRSILLDKVNSFTKSLQAIYQQQNHKIKKTYAKNSMALECEFINYPLL